MAETFDQVGSPTGTRRKLAHGGRLDSPPPHAQTENAFQKQDAIFLGSKRLLAKKGGSKTPRYYKNIGLGFKTPKGAIEGSFVDKKCPFTGNVSIRGRILKGVVLSTKMKRTIIIRRDYLRYVKKYRRCVGVVAVGMGAAACCGDRGSGRAGL